MTSRAPSSRQHARLFQAPMLRKFDQSLITNDHILRQSPPNHARSKDSRDVKASLVSSIEPGVGMQEHSIACFPNGLCDECNAAASLRFQKLQSEQFNVSKGRTPELKVR